MNGRLQTDERGVKRSEMRRAVRGFGFQVSGFEGPCYGMLAKKIPVVERQLTHFSHQRREVGHPVYSPGL